MINYELIHQNDGIPMFQVNLSLPSDFERDTLHLQGAYIKYRSSNNHPPLKIEDKLIELEGLSISKIKTQDFELYPKLLAWNSLNLLDIFVLFQDKSINEIFCNNLGGKISISHFEFGKCTTNLYFSNDFWKALKLQCEYNSEEILNMLSPSLKSGWLTDLGNLRITLQIPPLTPKSPAFVIRRLPKIPIQLPNLISMNQISPEMAEKLIQAVKNRNNIIIAGEPGSGKTTLANALLFYSSQLWRLIVIEDTRETNLPVNKYPFVTRYNIPSISSNKKIDNGRKIEISKLLHRSPDYVFLGEIQTEEDTKAAFEAFSAGIKGIATTHAKNFDTLINRWKYSHNLKIDLIGSIDIIILMRRIFTENIFKLQVGDCWVNDNGQFRKYE